MSPRLPRVTADEVLRALSRDGWFIIRQRGSHVVLAHPTKSGLAVVPRHQGRTLTPGVINSILTQAELTPEEFRRLL